MADPFNLTEAHHHQVAYVQTQDYSDKRQLDLEKILVPPPILDFAGGTPTLDFSDVEHFHHLNGSCGNPEFLRSIRSHCLLRVPHVMLGWKYEHRTKAQPILPFLLLGPGAAAQSLESVQTNGITMMVAVRSHLTAAKLPKYLDPAFMRSAQGLQSITVDLNSAYDLIRNLRGVLKAINDHLENSCIQNPLTAIADIKGKILVFCESGNERSTVVVCAYLMVVYGVDAVTAIQIVQSQRFSIDVKDDMKSMLCDFQNILLAERQVAEEARAQLQHLSNPVQLPIQAPTLRKPSKRAIDQTDDSDDEMGDWPQATELSYMQRRTGSAPFADTSG